MFRRMLPLFLVTLIVAAVPAFAQSLSPTYDTTLFDSTGKSMGSLLYVETSAGAGNGLRFRLQNGRSVFAEVIQISGADQLPAGFTWTLNDIGFSELGCTGIAGAASLRKYADGEGYVIDGNHVLYLSNGPKQPMSAMSVLSSLGTCVPLSVSADAYPLLSYLDLDTLYTPPFGVNGPPPPVTATFTDVPTTHPFFQFVEIMVRSGLTAGCGGGNYCPNTAVTRGQMAVFLAQAMGLRFTPAP